MRESGTTPLVDTVKHVEGDRWRGREEICKLLEEWIAARDLKNVGNTFDRAGVLWGPYQTFKQLVAEDPRASTANELFAEVDQPALGRYIVPGSPVRFGGAEAVPPRPAPELGANTKEVLEEFGID